MYGISSIRSYVVKRRPHFKHSRRRRIASPPRLSRESITLSSAKRQNGHFTARRLPFAPAPRPKPRPCFPSGRVLLTIRRPFPRSPDAAVLRWILLHAREAEDQ